MADKSAAAIRAALPAWPPNASSRRCRSARSCRHVLKPALAIRLAIAAAFAFGALRVTLIAPQMALAAVALECRRSCPHGSSQAGCSVAGRSRRKALAMGALAFASDAGRVRTGLRPLRPDAASLCRSFLTARSTGLQARSALP